jgi:hypothetical protein
MIWIEILSRHREVAARFRFAGPEVRIGRGYDNDVIVDDPYVAPSHVRVFRDVDGLLVAEDLGSANGMFLDRGKERRQRIAVEGEHPIRIGQSYLRIREASHPVESERVAAPHARLMPIMLAVLAGAAIIAIDTFRVWIAQTGEPRASSYLVPPLTIAAVVALWVAVWALLSRIFSGRAHFERNLLVALVGVLAISLYNELAQFAAFALTWRTAASYEYAAMWVIVAAICFFHLREVGPSRLKLKAAAVATLAVLAIALQTLQRSEALYDFGRQNIARQLLPPALRLAPVRDEKVFFAGVERLKAEIDGDRAQSRADGGGR